jgi:23S rRNA pseudouridine2605 synthase
MVIARSTRKAGAATKKSTNISAGKPRKKTERKVLGPKRQPREIPKTGHEDELIRLNKYLASTGICSRREADEFIKAGLVTVNGKLVTELGVKIKPGDLVKYNGETLREEKKVYILINKPKDYITTVEDPHAKKTILDLVKGACKERVYPVGRLDRNTTGVLLLTNDGELTKRLTHPKFEKLKIYHIQLNKNLKYADLEKVATGIHLDDGLIKADAISYTDSTDKSQVGIEIHSGRNHIVRRIFESLGYEVVKLDRVYFAGLTKKSLHRGEWRFLSEKEVNMLKMNAFK